VIVGGNLSVGSKKSALDTERLHALGVDHVLSRPQDLLVLLDEIAARRQDLVEVAAS